MRNFGNAINKYRRARWFYLHHMKPIAWLYRSWIYLIHNSFIPYQAQIGKGTIFGYKGIGVVIHSLTKIGNDCVIGTNVTIGGGASNHRRTIEELDEFRGIVPTICNRVVIGSGAKILGRIVVADDAIIGANAVVIDDVPPGAVVGGYLPELYAFV